MNKTTHFAHIRLVHTRFVSKKIEYEFVEPIFFFLFPLGKFLPTFHEPSLIVETSQLTKFEFLKVHHFGVLTRRLRIFAAYELTKDRAITCQ